MLPVVDANWHLGLETLNSTDFHVLRAIAVQTNQSHSDSLDQLAELSDKATTPGSGGLPNAIVVYCDIAGVDAREQLPILTAHERVRGINFELRQKELSTLIESLDFLQAQGLSLDVTGEINSLGLLVSIAKSYPDLSIVLNVSQWHSNGQRLPINEWRSSLSAIADFANIYIKVAGRIDIAKGDRHRVLENVLQEVVRLVGIDRLILGSGTLTAADDSAYSGTSLWSCLSAATRWASASDRNKLFRSTAMQVYRMS